MQLRFASWSFAALTMTLLMAAAATAADDDSKTHDGLVVSVSEEKLVMTDKDGKGEHDHEIGKTAKITLNGKAAKLADLKKGDKIVVHQNKKDVVVKVVATR